MSKKIILIAFSTIIALLSGALNWLNQFVIVGLLFFLAGYFLNKDLKLKRKINYNFIFLILPFFLVFTLFTILKGFYHVLPISIISIIGAFIGTVLAMKKRTLVKSKTTYLFLTFLFIFGYLGMPNWIHHTLYNEKIVLNSFPKDLILKKQDNTIFNLYKEDKNKVIVLDFWSSTCASCIRYFPKFEEKYLKFKDSSTVFYTINLPISKRDAKLDIHKYVEKYKFISLYAKNDIWKKLNIKQTPTYIILDKNFNIVYRASALKEKKWYYFNDFNSLIKKLKNE